jgi:hypothetical protein
VLAAVAAGVLHTTNAGKPAVSTGADGTGDLTASQTLVLAAQHSALASTATGRYWLTATESHELKLAGNDGALYKLDDASAAEHWTAKSDSDTGRTVEKSLSMVPATKTDRSAWQRAGSPAKVDLHLLGPNLKESVKKDVPINADVTTVTEQPARTTVHGVAADKAGSSFVVGDQRMSLPQIRQLPTDRARLRKIMLSGYQANSERWTQDRWLFSTASDILIQPVTPGVRASIYRILAALPSIHSAGQIHDIKGRPGNAVAITWNGPQGAQEDRLIIDTTAGSLLATETRLLKPISALAWLKPTDLWNTTVITRSGWTDDTPPAKADIDKPAKTFTLKPVSFTGDSANVGKTDAAYLANTRGKLTTAKIIACVGYGDGSAGTAADQALGLTRAKAACAIVTQGLRATVHLIGKHGNGTVGHVDIVITR